MTSANTRFAAGYAAFRAENYALARRELERSSHPQALHLLGLVERRCGNLERAEQILARAAQQDPANHEIAHNQALVALQQDRPSDAEQFARRALGLAPQFQRAAATLGRALLNQQRWADALAHYQPLYAADPENIPIRFGLGSALLECGDTEQARALFDGLVRAGEHSPQVRFMRGRSHLECGDLDAAIADLYAAHADEATALTVRELANALWISGRHDELDAVLDDAVKRPGLAAPVGEIWRQREMPARAVAAAAHNGGPRTAAEFIVTALALIDDGDGAGAERAARRGLQHEPDNAAALSALVSALLMQGDAQQALQALQPMRAREPLGQHWIAYEASALRLVDPERHGALVDMDRLVRAYELPVPPGFASLAEFNARLLDALKTLHAHGAHPLGQSLRGGSQTSRDLRSVDDPVIQMYLQALDQPIRQYLQDIGNAPDHPMTARNRNAYRFAGCWSVWLRGGGRHVSHVHPEGWISSAYYVSVPPTKEDDDARAGWIKFGEPPFPTVPPSPPQKWLQPRPGLLVLFPSFLWHGTHPIADQAIRVTAPFDLIPG